jgi:protein SCO1/2
LEFSPVIASGIFSYASAFRFGSMMAMALSVALFSCPGQSAEIPKPLQDVGILDKNGAQVAIRELTFRDETGAEVRLEKYFQAKRPVILTLVYYECPNLCNFLLNGLVDSMKPLEWTPGKRFDIVSVSINPKETPELATAKKASYLKSYGRPEASEGWHFLTGSDDQVRRLADQVGFQFKYDEKEQQYAHAAGLFVLTPEGRLSRTLYGIAWQVKDLRLALLEASNGKIGTVIDRILLFCYRYNPDTRKYSMALMRVMQAGGAITVLMMVSMFMIFWRKQRREGKG